MPALILAAIGAIVEGIETTAVAAAAAAEGGEAIASGVAILSGTGILLETLWNSIKGKVLKSANISSASSSANSKISELDIAMDAINTTLAIAQVINVAYWVIDSPETQSIISEINSQSFEATNQDGMIIDGIPVYENIPWADSFPSYENPSSSINGVPALENTDPGISIFPDTKPLIPSTESFPVETPKRLGDNILWLGDGQGTLPENRSIDPKILKKLKGMGLDKKFVRAMEIGFAPRREGTSGIIELSKGEYEYNSGHTYTYKIKVAKAPNHTRVYGYVNEAGELVFDYILNKKD